MRTTVVKKSLIKKVTAYISDKVWPVCNRPDFYYILTNIILEVPEDEEGFIDVKSFLLEDVCQWCEKMSIYDKLGNYDDFYYKFKMLLK